MRMSPKDFWSLTPREWGWLMAATAPAAGVMRRADLGLLSAQYPDEKADTLVATEASPLPIGERLEFAQRISGEGEGLLENLSPSSSPSSGPSGHLLPDGEKGTRARRNHPSHHGSGETP